MCKTPKPKAETATPDLLITRRDGAGVSQGATARKKSGLRLDLNSPQQYTGLTIPRG